MKIALILLSWLLSTGSALAYDVLQDDDDRPRLPEPEWHEGEVEIPEGYNPEDLQVFTPDGSDPRFQFFIERGSLKTAEDGVTRYLLVIRSRQGAVNSSYEGMRCGRRLYKVYAYGDARRLTPISGGDWRPIPRGGSSDYHTRLYEDLLCSIQTGKPNPPGRIFRAMDTSTRVEHRFFNDIQ